MNTTFADRTSHTQRVAIEDLEMRGNELSEEYLQLASGGYAIICASYEAASSTFCNDTDFHRVD